MSSTPGVAPAPGSARPDPAIESLNLSPKAKAAAYQLKSRFPGVIFTSGRRGRDDQARAMASNVALNRKWIVQTYMDGDAVRACQQWVDQHPEKVSKADIAAGLTAVFNSLSDAQVGRVSKHLSGDAFDVQPVPNGEGIKQMLRDLTQQMGGKFLDREGGLERWHAQF